jgi:UDP-N-acetylmuramate--alanine ligase
MFFKKQHLHFVGIGGIGMSSIAEVLLNLGYTISGSDLKLSAITARLSTLGATVYEGHSASNVSGAKAIVVTSAVDETNPEIQEARRLQMPVIPRGELLAELMRLKFGIAVGGSHGKTSTTSMIATILNHAGLDPTVVVGGKVATMGGSNARVGRSEFLVVESDESDGSFLKLAPIFAIVTNIDREHLDHYANIEEIRQAFTQFVNKVPFYGSAFLCLDDENVQQILPQVTRRTITYGRSAQADFEITRINVVQGLSHFELRHGKDDLGEFELYVPGEHNVLNATAAIATALELDIRSDVIREGLAQFRGVDRRFQVKGVECGVTVVDDYGHHPTEIRATLAAARGCDPHRLHVLFQPHRYTRTMHLMDEFARSFHQADRVLVLDIYAASEQAIEGVNAEILVDRMRQYGHRGAEYVGSIANGILRIVEGLEAGDMVITLGAGSVSSASEMILEGLRRAGGEL